MFADPQALAIIAIGKALSESLDNLQLSRAGKAGQFL